MPGFTKGKWIYDEPFGVIVSDETCAVIASVQGAGTGSCFCLTQEGQANARLIAAAPELYEAVYDLLDYAYEALHLAGGENEIRGKAPRILRDIQEYQELLARINGTGTGHEQQPPKQR